MRQQLLGNWTLFRVIRTALGVFIVIQGIINRDTFSILLGSVFSGMALFNVGCCADGNCAVPPTKVAKNSESIDITYEEIKKEG